MEQTQKIKPGTIIIFILLGFILISAIFFPFIIFLMIFLTLLPLILYLLLRKKFGRIASFFLTLLLSVLLTVLILGATGYILYNDFLKLQNDFTTKSKYVLYKENQNIFVASKLPGSQDGKESPRFLNTSEFSSLESKDALFIILNKNSFLELDKPLLIEPANFTIPQVLEHLESNDPQDLKNILAQNLILTTVKEGGFVYAFKEFKEGNIQIKPTYLTLQVVKGLPLSLVEQVATKDLSFLDTTKEQPSKTQ